MEFSKLLTTDLLKFSNKHRFRKWNPKNKVKFNGSDVDALFPYLIDVVYHLSFSSSYFKSRTKNKLFSKWTSYKIDVRVKWALV